MLSGLRFLLRFQRASLYRMQHKRSEFLQQYNLKTIKPIPFILTTKTWFSLHLNNTLIKKYECVLMLLVLVINKCFNENSLIWIVLNVHIRTNVIQFALSISINWFHTCMVSAAIICHLTIFFIIYSQGATKVKDKNSRSYSSCSVDFFCHLFHSPTDLFSPFILHFFMTDSRRLSQRWPVLQIKAEMEVMRTGGCH